MEFILGYNAHGDTIVFQTSQAVYYTAIAIAVIAVAVTVLFYCLHSYCYVKIMKKYAAKNVSSAYVPFLRCSTIAKIALDNAKNLSDKDGSKTSAGLLTNSCWFILIPGVGPLIFSALYGPALAVIYGECSQTDANKQKGIGFLSSLFPILQIFKTMKYDSSIVVRNVGQPWEKYI